MFSSRKLLTLSLIIVAVVAVAAGIFFSQLAAANPAQAQRSETRRWEYCAITRISFGPNKELNETSSADVAYFGDSGRRIETIGGGRNNDPFAAAIAKLGAEGWEMIGPGSQDMRPENAHIFFKRPMP